MAPGDWSLRQCLDCGTSFLDPMPDAETLATYYDQDYYGFGAGKFLGPVEVIVRIFRYLRARTIQRLVPKGRVLDVGCGRGVMLQFLKRWHYDVDGVELDTVAAKRARDNLNQEVFHSLDEALQDPPRQYQAVCFWHSLEHLPEPGQALRTVNRLLTPGGLLVISAPHMESLQSRLSRRSWLHLDLPRHLVHFDMNGLARFLQVKGYQVIWQEHFSQEYNVIDTLCYLYAILGFGHLYPFELLRGMHRHGDCINKHTIRSTIGLSLLLPLAAAALYGANLFSLLKSGSCVTLFLRKRRSSAKPLC
jgi:SAM-dependent methyltransferase